MYQWFDCWKPEQEPFEPVLMVSVLWNLVVQLHVRTRAASPQKSLFLCYKSNAKLRTVVLYMGCLFSCFFASFFFPLGVEDEKWSHNWKATVRFALATEVSELLSCVFLLQTLCYILQGISGNRASHKSASTRQRGVCATGNSEFHGCSLKLFFLLKGDC